MRRRGVTVLVGAILLVLLTWQASIVRVPYVEMGPGPTYDTLGQANGKPVISVTGADATTSAGQLRMTTVEVRSDLSLADAVIGWWQRDYAVVPRELIYPPDKSEQDVEEDNARDFERSQTSAETAALRELGYPVEVTVSDVVDGYPAQNVLAKGDVITAVDGVAATSALKLAELVRSKPVDTPHEVTFKRSGQTRTVTITAKKADDGSPRLGVSLENKQVHPFELKIELDRIGGPSAGLMFTLGIIDTLKPQDLTGGIVIAGTGTIDEEGDVGPIGGIPQKLIAARKARAKVFLTPADNCQEALANAQPGLPLIKVGTLDDALNALDELRAGRTPPLCSR